VTRRDASHIRLRLATSVAIRISEGETPNEEIVLTSRDVVSFSGDR